LTLQGHGLEDGVTIGPLINEAAVAKIEKESSLLTTHWSESTASSIVMIS